MGCAANKETNQKDGKARVGRRAMWVILDTNILLSAFFKADSPPNLLVHAWMDGRFDLLSCAEQIEEITRVARYPHVRQLIHSAEIGWLINRLRDRQLC